MPFCPKCKESIKDPRATECPECGTKLVAELPFQTVPTGNATWVEIASIGTDDEAKILQGFLQAEGIPAQVENVKFNMEPTNFGKLGDIRVYVSAEDESRALELMREREKEWDKLEDDDDTLVTDDGVAEVDDDSSGEPE